MEEVETPKSTEKPANGLFNLKANGGFGPDAEASSTQLQRELHSRHLQFIAIGGAIGTGLFLGSGKALATAGPVGSLIAFAFVGLVLYSVMTSLCEMATFIPVAGSFTSYAARFVDPSLGFAMGWTYWFSWAITFATELTAAALIIQYWNTSVNIGIFIAVFWAVFSAANFLPIRWFGEVEMWLSSIKVVTIVGFVIFAICVNAGVGDQGYLGFHHWSQPQGPFVEYLVPGATGKFVGVWAVLITASFSYQGAELVGVGAGETADPRKNVPAAVRWTFWGILSLFLATIFFIGLLVPSDNSALLSSSEDASASPLVIAADLAGVRVLPDIINAVLLTAVLTAANSSVYSGSRILVALARERHAPAFLGRADSRGVPCASVLATAAFGLLAFMKLSDGGTTVFTWFMDITAVSGLICWGCINASHLRFMAALAAQGVPRSELPYAAPFQPWLAWFGLFFNALIALTSGFTVFMAWSTSDFFADYVSIMLFVVLYIGHKVVYRTKIPRLEDVVVTKDRST